MKIDGCLLALLINGGTLVALGLWYGIRALVAAWRADQKMQGRLDPQGFEVLPAKEPPADRTLDDRDDA